MYSSQVVECCLVKTVMVNYCCTSWNILSGSTLMFNKPGLLFALLNLLGVIIIDHTDASWSQWKCGYWNLKAILYNMPYFSEKLSLHRHALFTHYETDLFLLY